jgi:glycosyltransferase involved in cell wall biosynthesis
MDNPPNSLRVVFVTVGYPSNAHPDRGIFIHRTVREISKCAVVNVIHLRTWQPSLPVVEQREWDGIQVLSVALPQVPRYEFKRMNTLILSFLGKYFVSSLIQSADIIHSTGLFPAGYIGAQWAKLFDKPHVSQAIGSDVNVDLANDKLSGKDKSWLQEIDGIACNSKEIRSKLLSFVPTASKVRVIYRGVDPKMFTPNGTLDGPQSKLAPVRFLYLGGFQTWNPNKYGLLNVKGGHILLEAWKKAETSIGNSSLLLSGPGVVPSRLDPWISSLQRPDAVFVLPPVPPSRVSGLLRSCDVVIIPSLNEGLPNFANEAQASGRPVLGSNAGGIPETVIDGVTGKIIPKGDVNQLADGIIWFYQNVQEIASMGGRAQQHMIEDFCWLRTVQDMISLYKVSVQHYSNELN